MLTRETLSGEHRRIDAMASELLAIAARSTPPVEGLSSLRWRLNHQLMLHLVKEDKLLYPALRRSPDAEIAAIATRFSEEMGGLAEAFIAYMQAWNGGTIAADWAGFCAHTQTVMLALRERIRREERDLYPKLRDDRAAQNRAA